MGIFYYEEGFTIRSRSGGFRGGAIAPPFKKNFSIFPSKTERKMSLHYLGWPSKSDFYLKSPLPSKILDPPLRNRTKNILLSGLSPYKFIPGTITESYCRCIQGDFSFLRCELSLLLTPSLSNSLTEKSY